MSATIVLEAPLSTITALKPIEKLILSDIMTICNVNANSCQKSDARWSWQFGVGLATTARAVKRLCELDIVEREFKLTPAGGTRIISIKPLNLARFIELSAVKPPVPKAKAKKDALSVANKAPSTLSCSAEVFNSVIDALCDKYPVERIASAFHRYEYAYQWSMAFGRKNVYLSHNPTDAMIAELAHRGIESNEDLEHLLDGQYALHKVAGRDTEVGFIQLLSAACEEQLDIESTYQDDLADVLNNGIEEAPEPESLSIDSLPDAVEGEDDDLSDEEYETIMNSWRSNNL